jgi:hypothetical protein
MRSSWATPTDAVIAILPRFAASAQVLCVGVERFVGRKWLCISAGANKFAKLGPNFRL